MARVVLLLLLPLIVSGDQAMQLTRQQKTQGAVPNTCGLWKYGTPGREGEAQNPFCKSTDIDMGTTGTTNLLEVPEETRAMTQTLQFDEKDWTGASPAYYRMTTSYWNDAPCKSGWMFATCVGVSYRNCKADSHDFGFKVNAYQTKDQFKANPNCVKGEAMSFCCNQTLGGCPKQACPGRVDLNDNCSVAPVTCPQWPQCINKPGKCNGKPGKCSGLAGEVGDNSCAFSYPGCGAVNRYDGFDYGGAPAIDVMHIVATGTAKKVETIPHNTTDTPMTLSLKEKYNKLCGAKNNLFSYSAAGSADLLAQAAQGVQRFNCEKNALASNGAWVKRINCTGFNYALEMSCDASLNDPDCICKSGERVNETAGSADECDPSQWQCVDGHPTWCACANIVEISLSSLKIYTRDSTLRSAINRTCSCINSTWENTTESFNGGSINLYHFVDLKGCNTSNCNWLNSIGYNTSAPVNTTKWYAQYYRPVQSENTLYLGAQQKDLDHALDTPFHAEGVYTLRETCAGCCLQIPLMLATVVPFLGFYAINLH